MPTKLLTGCLLALITLLAGCASGPRFFPIQGEAGKAVVYVYRDNLLVGRGLDLEVSMNDEMLATLATGTYVATRVAPGEYTFKARARRGLGPKLTGVRDDQLRDNTLLRLQVAQGLVYYVEVEEGLGYVLLEPTPKAAAWPQLERLKRVEGSL